MPRPKRIALGGYVYHVLNRANGRLRIFRKAGDFLGFERILAEGVERFEMRICGYCIMSDHWHLVLWPREDDDLSAFMRWITQTHTQRYHSSHGTVGIGHLYQGRYKSFPVQDEAYYLTVLRYVEANPLRAGLVEKAGDWPWSSYAVRRGRESLVELAEGPVSLPGNWPALVHQSVAETDVCRVQNSMKRGTPLGLGQWVFETARRMVLESTLRPKGRPKKSTGPLSRGFTLVELLVVIVIISVLLSILIPSLHKARSSALRIACAHNLKQIGLAVDLYLADNDNTYPCAQDPVDPNYWLWMGRGWRQRVEPYVGGSIGVKNPSVLLCPEDRTDPGRYESTSYAYSMAFYHSPEQIDAMSEPADTYASERARRSIPQRSGSVAHPAAKILIGEWLSNHAPLEIDDDQGWWCWLGERCFLLADGQVRFLKATEIRPARDDLPDANLTVNGIKGRDLAR